MEAELERVANLLREARDPEDVFGTESVMLPRSAQLARRRETYEALKAVTALEYLAPEANEMARDLDNRLETFYRRAQTRIEAGAYNLPGRGQAVPLRYQDRYFEVGSKRYTIGPRYGEGDEAVFYNGWLEADGAIVGEVLLKVAKSPEQSPFLEREANALAILCREEYRETAYLPCPLDRFESDGRMGTVLRRVDGFNLRQVRDYWPHRQGLDGRDMAWMLGRTLGVVGLAHMRGIVHGRICPEHILIEPATHLTVVAGWGGCAIVPARSGQRIAAGIPTFSAPELAAGDIGPWCDVYSIGKTYLWLMGGNAETGELPASVAPRIAAFLRHLCASDPKQRPEDCWKLLETFGRIRDELWGERKWRPFDMPSLIPMGRQEVS